MTAVAVWASISTSREMVVLATWSFSAARMGRRRLKAFSSLSGANAMAVILASSSLKIGVMSLASLAAETLP